MIDRTGVGYEMEQKVSFLQIDCNSSMTPAALLSQLQEMAILHSDSLGFTGESLQEQGWFWSVVNWHLKIYRMPRYREKIILQTWNDKFSRFQANRSFYVFDEDGNKLVDGISRWVFMDLIKRRPANVPAGMAEKYDSGKESAIPDEKFLMPKEPEGELIAERKLTVTRRDTDTNNHANNVKYLEWVMDDIPDDVYVDMALKDIRIVYRRECMRNDVVTVKTFVRDSENGKIVDSFLYEGGTVVAQVITEWEFS